MDILVVLGSKSDLDVAKETTKILKDFGVDFSVEVSSAHRTPERTIDIVKNSEKNGCKVIIAIAGAAAHLGGVIASHTILPVITVPVDSSPLKGIDALLSSVMMPPGIPVGCMAVGKMGAKNGAIFALEILSLSDTRLRRKIEEFRENMSKRVIDSSAEVKRELE